MHSWLLGQSGVGRGRERRARQGWAEQVLPLRLGAAPRLLPEWRACLLVRMERENHPNLEQARRLLGWNGGGANSSGRGIANIDTQGNVHPDQFWQDVVLGNVKRMPFSRIWEGGNELSAPMLDEIRSVGLLGVEERRERMHGRCADCKWFKLCGGGFRTRAAFANGDLWGSDPGCYLDDREIAPEVEMAGV